MEILFHSFIQAPFKHQITFQRPAASPTTQRGAENLLSLSEPANYPFSCVAPLSPGVTWHVPAPEPRFTAKWEWLSSQTLSKTSAFLRHVCFGCSKVSSPFNRWQMHYPAQTGSPYDGVEGQNRWHMSHSHSRRRRWKHAPALASCWRLLAKDNWGVQSLALNPHSLPGERGIAAQAFLCASKVIQERAGGCGKTRNSPTPWVWGHRTIPRATRPLYFFRVLNFLVVFFSTYFAVCFNSLCLAALGMLPVFFSLFFSPAFHNPSMGNGFYMLTHITEMPRITQVGVEGIGYALARKDPQPIGNNDYLHCINWISAMNNIRRKKAVSSITLLLSIHCVKTKIDIISDSYHLETALYIWVRIQSQSANTFAHDYFYILQEISLKFSVCNIIGLCSYLQRTS